MEANNVCISGASAVRESLENEAFLRLALGWHAFGLLVDVNQFGSFEVGAILVEANGQRGKLVTCGWLQIGRIHVLIASTNPVHIFITYPPASSQNHESHL